MPRYFVELSIPNNEVMQRALTDIDYLLQEGFDTNVDDCDMDGVKETIKALKEHTNKSMGFYVYGDTPESVTPESPFILSGNDTPYDFSVEVTAIEETE